MKKSAGLPAGAASGPEPGVWRLPNDTGGSGAVLVRVHRTAAPRMVAT